MFQTEQRVNVYQKSHISIREVTCQCAHCKDIFQVEGRFKYETLTALLPHRKIIYQFPHTPVHICGHPIQILTIASFSK
jgi:hypothetical protein